MSVDFRPLPFLGNPHVQTVLGSLFKGPTLRFPSQEHLVSLPDGDRLLLHDSVPVTWRAGDWIVLLVHGLGGSHDSGYMHRMARRLVPRGIRVVRMDLRGCGKGMALARRPYHGGCSEDVRAVVEEIEQWSPASRVAVVGFSLGGNIALKLAGEASRSANLAGIAAVSPPIDMERCAELLASPRNRLYELHYVRGLVHQVGQRRALHADEPMLKLPRKSMRMFDDHYTAPRWGFDGALDYYRRASSEALIERITVPTLILTARDDPFIAVESFEQLQTPTNIEVQILPRGGHLGFLGRNATGGVRWAECRVVEWLIQNR